MRNIYLSSLLLFLLIVIWSCNSDQLEETNTELPPEVLEKIYVSMVNDLRCRTLPGKSGEIVDKLSIGDLVYGNGERGEDIETVVLRGVIYKEPYIQCWKDSGKDTFWVYGGGIQQIGIINEDLQKEEISAFVRFLDKLNISDPSAGEKALHYVTSNLNGLANADAILIILERFYQSQILSGFKHGLTNIRWQEKDINQIDQSSFKMETYPATRQLAKSGFRLAVSEGMVVPEIDWDRIATLFSNKVGTAMQEYVRLKQQNQKQPAIENAEIQISLVDLVDRCRAWERLVQEGENFIFHNQAAKQTQMYMQLIQIGSDNTPAYDPQSSILNASFKQAWDYAIRTYPNSELTRELIGLSNRLEQNGWRKL